MEATDNPTICQRCQEYLINFANLLFLLFSYKDDIPTVKSEHKNYLLKRVKRENNYYIETGKNSVSKIKTEHIDDNLNENVEYSIKQELGQSIELPEVQFKTEDVQDNIAVENNG